MFIFSFIYLLYIIYNIHINNTTTHLTLQEKRRDALLQLRYAEVLGIGNCNVGTPGRTENFCRIPKIHFSFQHIEWANALVPPTPISGLSGGERAKRPGIPR